MNSRIDCAIAGGLAEASFWDFVIQDIEFSLAYQRPLRLHSTPFSDCLKEMWSSDQSRSDRSWTHQAIWLLAETIQCCYNTDRSKDHDYPNSETLREKIDQWQSSRPDSFQPLFYAEPETNEAFPKIWYSQSWHGNTCSLLLSLPYRILIPLQHQLLNTFP